ncbi:hypothetical protein [Roseiconus lacunae]|uniref:Uncharacterized protein n=1 Tax=Roseiconus lacunae TaxID=2605694 RepID=A0ABT7PMF2_9BACT|nr:hypothetical protein [Roseiconus lacunae]MCD0461602.1 hypothetical protein [Roseiconus lacunae]MDM4017679.1 hypothetical protein [Roseiconus lacunae]WRQ51060.1 hypothetical protein U8335_00640 [Stieleria sp. HD01]
MLGALEILNLFEALALPVVGLWALLSTKLLIGDDLVRAERRFIAVLVITSLITLRTVAGLHDAWLIHTVTLSAMVLGVFVIPGRGDEELAAY